MTRSFFILCFFISCFVTHSAFCQGNVKAVQFSGVVVGGKNSEVLPGATIYIPKAGGGTYANTNGFFSLPVYPGDSIVFSYTGYQKQYFVLPRNWRDDSFSAKIQLREDAVTLREVKIYPYRNFEEFKKEFLAMNLPDAREREALARNTDPDYLRKMAMRMGDGGNTAFRISQDQITNYNTNKGFANTIPFFNPFSWASFIKDVKNGALKDDSWKELYKDAPLLNTNRDSYIRQQQKNNN
ncbi:MAG: carboxypeptidase-like regulatory domain-containing protein [Siphonobacter sp.]